VKPTADSRSSSYVQFQVTYYTVVVHLFFFITYFMYSYLCCAFLSVRYSRLSPPWPNLSVCAAGAPTVTISYSVPAENKTQWISYEWFSTVFSQLSNWFTTSYAMSLTYQQKRTCCSFSLFFQPIRNIILSYTIFITSRN